MESPVHYAISVQIATPRGIAAVRARLPGRRVPAMFTHYLDQVYAATRTGAVVVDGQNIFVYRSDGPGDEVEVDFGVGVAAPFFPAGPVQYYEVPGGEVAVATHVGDYGRLGEAHAAVAAWCRQQGRPLAGPRWEIYGHWNPSAGPPRTDVCYLLAR